MVFKRREKRGFWKTVGDGVYPRGGWSRALHYISHRVQRLPDSPHRIARGLGVGVFVSFTPFFGVHLLIAALLARAIKGNIFAALIGTLFGNPLTFIPIAVVSLKIGHFLMGATFDHTIERSLVGKFTAAGHDLTHNLMALFTGEPVNWANLALFADEVFLPYLVGGLLPGLAAAVLAHYLSLPVIAAYQRRRRGRLKAKIEQLRRKKAPLEAE